MSYGMYISAAGAEVQSRRMQMLSHNLANVDTPGFKRELAMVQARYSEAIERGLDSPRQGSLNDVGGGVNLEESASVFDRGVLRHTSIPTDLALEPTDVFFVVDHDGQELLTRAGNFSFAADGTLQTNDGDPLLGIDGSIRINPQVPWTVSSTGSIIQEGAQVAQLRLVKPQNLADLSKVGGNMFLPLGPVSAANADDRRIRAGFLEQSTVKPASEMMELIETSRAYEANVRMIQHHDQMAGALINRMLRQA